MKTNYYIILQIVLFQYLFIHHVIAQDVKIDEFTGDTTVTTDLVYFNMLDYSGARMQLQKFNSDYYIRLQCYKSDVFSNNEGDKLMLKLSNGDMLELSAITEGVAHSKGKTWVSYISYPVTEQQLQAIKKQGIDKYRVYLTEGYLEGSVKRGANKNIAKMISKI